MTSFPPEQWQIPLDKARITSGDEAQLAVQQENLVKAVKKHGEQTASAVYGQSGKWTPVAVGSSSAGTCTYATNGQVGYYQRWGHMIWFTMYLEWNDSDHSGTGNLTITGLPVAARNVTNAKVVVPLVNMESGAEWQGVGIIAPNSKTISVVQNSTTTVLITGADYTLSATGMYRTI